MNALLLKIRPYQEIRLNSIQALFSGFLNLCAKVTEAHTLSSLSRLSYTAKMEANKIAKKDPYRLVRSDDRSDTHLEKLYDFSVNSIKLPKRQAVLRTKKTSTGAIVQRRSSGKKLRGKQSQDVSSSGFKGSHEEVCKSLLAV